MNYLMNIVIVSTPNYDTMHLQVLLNLLLRVDPLQVRKRHQDRLPVPITFSLHIGPFASPIRSIFSRVLTVTVH